MVNKSGWFNESVRHKNAKLFGSAPPYRNKKNKKKPTTVKISKTIQPTQPKQAPVVINFNVATGNAKIQDDDVYSGVAKPKKKKTKVKLPKVTKKASEFDSMFGEISSNGRFGEISAKEGVVDENFSFSEKDDTKDDDDGLMGQVMYPKEATEEERDDVDNEFINSIDIATQQGRDELKGEEQLQMEKSYNRYADQMETGQVPDESFSDKVADKIEHAPEKIVEDSHLKERLIEGEHKLAEKVKGALMESAKKVSQKLHEKGHPPETIQHVANVSESTSDEIVEDLEKQGLLKK